MKRGAAADIGVIVLALAFIAYIINTNAGIAMFFLAFYLILYRSYKN